MLGERSHQLRAYNRYPILIILNFYVLNLVKDGKADYKLAGVTIGLLTIVYTLYFASRHSQATMENSKKIKNERDEQL